MSALTVRSVKAQMEVNLGKRCMITRDLMTFSCRVGFFSRKEGTMTQTRKDRTTTAIPKLPIVFLGLLVLLALTTSAALAAPNEQDPVNGEQLWQEKSCKNCHGENGEGLWAGPLAGSDKTDAEWISQVREPRRRMPAFSAEQISDEDITDMRAYLITLAAPASFSPEDAGLPSDAPLGQQLIVEKRCVACHSTTGPIRGFVNRGETPTAEIVLAQLRTPRQNMPMYSSDQVSDEEASAIVDFLTIQISAPAQLPQSGGESVLTMPLIFLALGAGLVLTVLFMRLKTTNS
jgi:mono/diheme cytochrome c family protein